MLLLESTSHYSVNVAGGYNYYYAGVKRGGVGVGVEGGGDMDRESGLASSFYIFPLSIFLISFIYWLGSSMYVSVCV